jgi:AcrR family transcriptional regulator
MSDRRGRQAAGVARPFRRTRPPPHAPTTTAGRTERAERQRAERREQVLLAAAGVFAEKGYHAASITDVVERASVARGTFYLYFESKRAVFDELLDRMLGELQGAITRIDVSQGAPPAIDQLRANVERVLDVLGGHRALTRLLLREAVGLDAEFDEKLRAFYEAILARIRGALDRGRRVGLIRECDVELTAHCVLGGFKELAYELLVEGGGAAGRVDRERGIRALVEYNLRGLLV